MCDFRALNGKFSTHRLASVFDWLADRNRRRAESRIISDEVSARFRVFGFHRVGCLMPEFRCRPWRLAFLVIPFQPT